MATRIRSIYVEQWSDDAFCDLSPFARLLALALRNFADDHGVFPWKIGQIKRQCLPSDPVDVVPLLEELLAADIITRFEASESRSSSGEEGRSSSFGAIRNFAIFNWARHPSYDWPFPEKIKNYTGFDSDRALGKRKKGGNSQKAAGENPSSTPLSAGCRVEKGRVENKKIPSKDGSASDADPVQIAVSAFNAVAERIGLAQCRTITTKRRSAIIARMKEGGKGCWQLALEKLERSQFLRGANERGWKADFDFILQPKSFHRLIEGAYDDRPKRHGSTGKRDPQGPDMADLAEWAIAGGGDTQRRSND